jgi:hypothetical protein
LDRAADLSRRRAAKAVRPDRTGDAARARQTRVRRRWSKQFTGISGCPSPTDTGGHPAYLVARSPRPAHR